MAARLASRARENVIMKSPLPCGHDVARGLRL